MNWKDKVVWIVGASSGIGAELARQLHFKGARLILSSRNEERLIDLKQELSGDPTSSVVLPFDITTVHEADSVVATAMDCFQQVDVLILNAGVSQRSMAGNTSLAVDEQLMATNYFGLIAITKAMLPFLRGNSGQIAVTSSIAGQLSTPLRSAYCASKHALHGFYESLRAEEYASGIRISMICPGFIQTDISKHALTGDGSLYEKQDPGQSGGISVSSCAEQYIKAIENQVAFKVIAGFKERFGLFLSRYFPGLLRKMVRKIKVT